jgi:hypothetical protein
MDNIVTGRTKVRVMRKEVNEKNGHETVKEIHRGVVVSFTTSFARVYNPGARDKGANPLANLTSLVRCLFLLSCVKRLVGLRASGE